MDSDSDVEMEDAPQLLQEGEERFFNWISADSSADRPPFDENYFEKAVSELVKDIQDTTFEDPRETRFRLLFREIHKWTREHADISLTTELSKDPVGDKLAWQDQDVEEFLEVLIGDMEGELLSAGRTELRRRVAQLVTLGRELRRLHGLMDYRQPSLDEWPIGSLPRHSDFDKNDQLAFDVRLYQEWAFRRLFIRALHLPGTVPITNTREISGQITLAFAGLFEAAMLLHRSENWMTIIPDSIYDSYITVNSVWFAWIRNTIAELRRYMRVISEVVMDHENRPRGMDVDQDELHSFINEKLDQPEILWEIKRRSDGYMEDSPFERLILDLVCREYEFEDALVEDHAEDILVDKQVASLDIRDLTNQFSWINPEFFILSEIQANVAIQEHRIRNLLRRTQQYTRPRYGHRLFTDWQGARPWAKLYQLYNTEGENEWAADGIRTFRETTLQNADDETPGHTFGWLDPKPTEPRRKAGKVLGIHPINYSEQQRIHAAGGETHFPVLSACGVCIEQFQGGFTFENTVALLPCGHLHHLKCIFEFWDMPGKYLHTCPTCGSAPKLNWQKVGLDVNKGNRRLDIQFVHNLEGYEAENATAYANSPSQAQRALYDVPPMGSSRRADMLEEGPSRYWLRENTNALLYTTQRLDRSIPTWHSSKLGQPGRSGRFLESTSRRGGFQLRDASSYAAGGGALGGYVDEEAPGLSEGQRRQRRMHNANVWERQVRVMREERLIGIGDSWVAGRRRRPRGDGTWENVSMPQNVIRNAEIVERSRTRERFRVTSLSGPAPEEVDYFVLPGARFPPEQESAFLRRIRRQANAAARKKARVERRGLFALYSKV